MRGKDLHKLLKMDGRTIEQISTESKISRAQLYKLFDSEVVEKEYLDKLKAANVAVDKMSIFKGVPVYDVDFTAGDITQYNDFPEKVIGHIDLNGFRSCIAFVKVKGNSMFPTFTAGDLVGLEPQEDLKHIEYGQPYGIVTKGGLRLIKIIRKGKDNNNLILRSNNKEFDDIDLHKDDLLRLYKAHGPIRDSFL